MLAIDTYAHDPGRLTWQLLGCARAEEVGIGVNTCSADELVAWSKRSQPK